MIHDLLLSVGGGLMGFGLRGILDRRRDRRLLSKYTRGPGTAA